MVGRSGDLFCSGDSFRFCSDCIYLMTRIHLIGIGGSGMSGIARLLLERDYEVTGSDLNPSTLAQELAAVEDQQLEGRLTTREEALALVRRLFPREPSST